MEWYGVYEGLLFNRGAFNPPCDHLRGAVSADDVAVGRGAFGYRGLGAAVGNPATNGHGEKLSTEAAACVQNFLSDSPQVRARGCRSIAHIFKALGPAVNEFVLFLQEFEENEDDEEVLIALCNGIKMLFQGCGGDLFREKLLTEEGFSSLLNVLLRILIHRDRELKAEALGAFTALISACDDPGVLKDKVMSHVLELAEDQRDTFRQAAASLLPPTLLCTHRRVEAARTGETTCDAQALDALLQLKQRLLSSYVGLCGDKNCAVQLAAGHQLPYFVDFIAAEVEALQEKSEQKRDGSMKGGEDDGTGEIGELTIAMYTATQKFTLSLNESCRMQGVAAVAAMARRNATLFKALGTNFFPMLCSDSSWRVRASVCVALEDMAFLFSETTAPMQKEDGEASTDAAAACMPSLLFKFLTDRSPMVKIAALQMLQRTAQLVGNAAFVRDPWLLELHQIAEDERANLGSRLPGACLDSVIFILPLTTDVQRRSLLELALDLAVRGNWKLKMTFVGAMGSLTPDELELVSKVILSESFAVDEDGDDCWRVHAAVAQKLPVLLGGGLSSQMENDWWQRCHTLLVHPVWAVRQEAGAALRSLFAGDNQLHKMDSMDSLIQNRLLPALQHVASCKNAFIRQELAFYLHQIWEFLPNSRIRQVAMPLLRLLHQDPAPCCRLALAKLLRILCTRNYAEKTAFLSELKTMLEQLSQDEGTGIREEASASSVGFLEPPTLQAVSSLSMGEFEVIRQRGRSPRWLELEWP